MACRCGCGFDTVDVELARVLQGVCDHFSRLLGDRVYLFITGPNRCPAHNSAEGGAANSQHQYGRAADFKLKCAGVYISPDEVYNYLNQAYPDKYGIGIYSNRVHLDTRSNGPARWDER